MVREGLAGPFPRRQHPAPGQPEGAAAVCFALAPARQGFAVCAFRDDAVAQPDRAPLRTRRDREFGVQPFMMLPLGGGVGFDDFADRFRQVLGEVADVASGFLGAAQDALGLALLPEPHHVSRLRVVVAGEGIQRLIPRRERCAGVWVDERASMLIPQRAVFVVIARVDEVVVVGPPDLVVGGGDDLAGDLVGDRAP